MDIFFKGRRICRGYYQRRKVYQAQWAEGADLLACLPHWFRELQDFHALMETETEELEGLLSAMERVRKNLFVQTGDEPTIRQMEGLFGILAGTSESLAFRRVRVLNRLSIQPPFTLRFLYGKLDQLAGQGRWEVRVDYPGCGLYVSVMESIASPREILTTLDIIKPCHIQRFLEVRIPGVELWEQQRVRLDRLWVSARSYERGNRVNRLNGMRRLDGTWLLDGVDEYRAAMESMTIWARVWQPPGSVTGAVYHGSAAEETSARLEGHCVSAVCREAEERARCADQRWSVRAGNRLGCSAVLTADGMWRLDGAWALSGRRKLDADIIRSDLG